MHLAILLLSLAGAAAPQQELPAEEGMICASGRGTQLKLKELDELLILRHARSPSGREILQHLLEGRMVDAIASERDVTVREGEIEERVATLEDQVKK